MSQTPASVDAWIDAVLNGDESSPQPLVPRRQPDESADDLLPATGTVTTAGAREYRGIPENEITENVITENETQENVITENEITVVDAPVLEAPHGDTLTGETGDEGAGSVGEVQARAARARYRASVELEWWGRRARTWLSRVTAQLWQVLHSTFVALKRNGPLAFAGVLCSVVALTLVGSSLLVSRGVEHATARWRGGVETIVFLEPQLEPARVEEVGKLLRDDPRVADARYVDQDASLAEFREMFRNSPEMISTVTADVLPSSWRVVPSGSSDEAAIEALGAEWESRTGVYDVVYAKDAVESVMQLSRTVRSTLLAVAAALGVAALALAFAACRSAAFARREELAVMRLVGAPRWVVRWPFILEGALQGLVGGYVAACLTEVVSRLLTNGTSGKGIALLEDFYVTSGDLWSITGWCMLIGALLGALGASAAVTRYVRASEGVEQGYFERKRAERRVAMIVLRKRGEATEA